MVNLDNIMADVKMFSFPNDISYYDKLQSVIVILSKSCTEWIVEDHLIKEGESCSNIQLVRKRYYVGDYLYQSSRW